MDSFEQTLKLNDKLDNKLDDKLDNKPLRVRLEFPSFDLFDGVHDLKFMPASDHLVKHVKHSMFTSRSL